MIKCSLEKLNNDEVFSPDIVIDPSKKFSIIQWAILLNMLKSGIYADLLIKRLSEIVDKKLLDKIVTSSRNLSVHTNIKYEDDEEEEAKKPIIDSDQIIGFNQGE